MGISYLLRIVIVMLMLMLGLFARAEEIDVEEQIQREENPYYLEYLKEQARDYQDSIKTASLEVYRREKEEKAEEQARLDYIKWRDRQPVLDDEKFDRIFQKETEKVELQYLKDEKAHADYKWGLEQKQIAHQKRILEHNRNIASVMPPRVPKNKRKFKAEATASNTFPKAGNVRRSPSRRNN